MILINFGLLILGAKVSDFSKNLDNGLLFKKTIFYGGVKVLQSIYLSWLPYGSLLIMLE